MKATPCSYLVLFPLYHIVLPPSVVTSPLPNHLTSDKPIICHLYFLSSSSNYIILPHCCRVRTFHVPIVVTSFNNCFCFMFINVSYLPLLSWILSITSAVVVIPGLGRSGMLFCDVVISLG